MEQKSNAVVFGNTSPNTKHRSYILTINNPTQEIITTFLEDPHVKYSVYQLERGEKCGTPHLQGVLHYKNSMPWPKKRYPTAHIEVVHKLQDAINYCMKEETRIEGCGPVETGVRPQQGRRTDLEAIATGLATKTITMDTIATDHPSTYVRYFKGLQALEQHLIKPRSMTNPPKIYWLWGIAGIGKTFVPQSIFGEDHCYIKDGTQWWPNYNQEKCIIIDDFDGKWPYRDLLRLLDKYRYQGQYKGGYCQITSPYIFITCEFPPEDFWQDNTLAQVKRRLTAVHHLTSQDDSSNLINNFTF